MCDVSWSSIVEFFHMRAEAAEANGDQRHANFLRSLFIDLEKRVLPESELNDASTWGLE
jgi:hypothetical protein